MVAGQYAYTGASASAESPAALRVTATAKPASGSVVDAGDTIIYTLKATNEQAAADGQQVVDDLSGVMDNADLSSTADELAKSSLKLDPQAKKLTWALPALAAGSEACTSFRVTVAEGAPDGAALTTSAAPTGDSCSEGGDCATRITVSNPPDASPSPSLTAAPGDSTPASPTSTPGTSPTPSTSPTKSPGPKPPAATTPTASATPKTTHRSPTALAKTRRRNTQSPRAAAGGSVLAPITPCTGAAPAAGSPVAGFEIDGNLCTDSTSNIDWDTAGVQPVALDGADDGTQFNRGASEDSWPWQPRQTVGSGAPDSADITNVYGFTRTAGDVFAFVGFERVATTGTVAYHLELNRLPNEFGPTPDRSLGDLRLTLEQQGSSLIRLTGADTWTGTAWQSLGSLAGFVGKVNSAPVQNMAGTTLNPGQFAEIAVNLTQLFGPTCSGSYGTLNLRSSTSTSESASLADWVNPVALNVPDTCPSVRVDKTWVIDGTTFANGAQPPGFSAILALTGQTDPQFGVTYSTRSNGVRYRAGDVVTVGEVVSPLPGCTNVESGDSGNHTLVGGINAFAISNTVTCTYLTLRKTVDGGSATPGDWKLSATGPTSFSGPGNSLAVTKVHVAPGQYTLAETGPAGYQQTSLSCSPRSASGGVVTLVKGDNVTCTFTNTADRPKLTLVKSITSGDPFDAPGDVVSYRYLVTNTGNVRLAEPVTVADDRASDETCPALSTIGNGDGFLDPGEQVACTASYSVTQADLDAGSVTNLASARAGSTTSNTDSETAAGTQTPGMSLDKSAIESSYDTVGQVLHYDYLVTNTGNVTLTGVTLADDQESVDCAPTVLPATLAPGEEFTCTATHTVTQADLDAGSVVNVATADSGETDQVTDTVSMPATQNPGLSLEKSITAGDPFDSAGDVVTYGYLVTNTGNVRLAGPVTVADDRASNESCPALGTVGNGDGFLDPGESVTCTASYRLEERGVGAESGTNIASATADGTTSNTDTATADATQTPGLALEKSITEGDPFDSVGDVISYDFVVTNTGNVRLAGPVTVADDRASDESCPALGTVGNGDGFLDPGESVTCTATYTVTQADLDAGSVTNIASATADGTTSNTDTATADATQTPGLALEKSIPEGVPSHPVADVISYDFVVTNTGNVRLAGPVTVADDRASDESCPAL